MEGYCTFSLADADCIMRLCLQAIKNGNFSAFFFYTPMALYIIFNKSHYLVYYKC